MAYMKRRKFWKTGEVGLCYSSSAIQLGWVPHHCQKNGVKSPLFLLFLVCCRLPPKLGETAKVYRQIWSFLFKTNIVILTCTTDTAQTPNHPTLMNNIFTTTLRYKMKAACIVRPAAPADPYFPHHFIYSNNTPISGENGREYVSCTGKYDNISLKLKTTYWHTYNLYN